MKKFLLFATAASLFLTACSGSRGHENEQSDTANKADSTATVDSAKEGALKMAEQARLDSLRADSIAKAKTDAQVKAEMEAKANLNLNTIITKFQSRNPSVYNLTNFDARTVMTGLGFEFTGSSRTVIYDDFGDISTDKLNFKNGDIKGSIWLNETGTGLLQIAFNFPNNSDAQQFINASKAALGKKLKAKFGGYTYLKGSEYWFMKQTGNKIEIKIEENTDGEESYN